jgi:hypothetical protein
MGQFKPMVKMMTTEPSIELKLKKGGHVAMPKMKSKDNGTGSKKMAMGGTAMQRSCGTSPDRTAVTGGATPAKPTMSQRRKAMMGRKMAEGGDALKKHAALPASKAHKGLKTGGVAMGQGGYKNGGSVIPVSASKRGAEKYDETLMHTAKPDRSPAKTGGVKNGNGGGYKKGGNVKKMALGGTAGMVKGLMNKINASPSVAVRGPNDHAPMPLPRRGSGPNDGNVDAVRAQFANQPMKSGVKPRGPRRMATGGQIPMPTVPRTGGGTPKPAPTMKDMLDRARTELMPKKPTLSGADYDKYMPGGPNNPLKPGRGGGPRNPRPMPRPVRDLGYGNGRMPTEQDWKNHAATAKYGSQAAMDAAKNDFMSKPLRNRRGFAKGGGVEGNVSSTPPGVTNTTTGGVRKGNAGGFKKGGAPKKFARGGSVNDSGKAVAMPQGHKRPPTPVSINQLSGTYKKGGKVRKYAEGGMSDKEQTKAYDRFYADEAAQNKAEREAFIEAMKNPLDAMRGLPERLRKGYEAISKGLKGSGSVTTTEREVSRTVTPAKKRSGGAC